MLRMLLYWKPKRMTRLSSFARQLSMDEEELRCCAHVIQLGVNDFLSRHREKIEEVKKILDHQKVSPKQP